jgi:hypothetical protein
MKKNSKNRMRFRDWMFIWWDLLGKDYLQIFVVVVSFAAVAVFILFFGKHTTRS